MNSLPFSPLVISFISDDFTGKTTGYKSCPVTLKRLTRNQAFPRSAKIFFVCIKFDKGGNSLPKHFERIGNIRSNL